MNSSGRVRVTGPRRGGTHGRPLGAGTQEIDEKTRLGEIYLGSLIREQQGLALRVLGGLFGILGTLPLVFWVWPGLATVHVVGVPLPWAILAGAVYPCLVITGWLYVRRAERHERDFAALVTTEEAR